MKTPYILSLIPLASAAAVNINGTHSCQPPQAEVGAVFAMTNDAADNEVIAFSRDGEGLLTQVGAYSTGGHGQGVDFDTQGGLQLSSDYNFLYALSPASDTVTVFFVKGSCLERVQTAYGGDQPLSITLRNGYAYVLTGSVASTGILGFEVDEEEGTLTPLTNTTIPLSTPIGVSGVVTFAPDGRSLVVANKVGNTLDVFAVGEDGKASATPETVISSSGQRPFAAIFGNSSTLYVVESGFPSFQNSALSSYRLNKGSVPSLTALTKSERNDQTDACWVAVTPDEKYVYTANFISGSISLYGAADNGTVSVIDGAAALPGGEGSEPVDLALSSDGKYLYNLLRGTGAVVGWEVEADGSLKQVGGLAGLGQGLTPMGGASGLAAF